MSKDSYTKHMNNFLGKMEYSNDWKMEIGRVLDCITNILMDRFILVRLCLVELSASYVWEE